MTLLERWEHIKRVIEAALAEGASTPTRPPASWRTWTTASNAVR
jgi:hypothetical protein